jgi:S-adenosyl-L-methionine hydrolase (adenosine-forming)
MVGGVARWCSKFPMIVLFTDFGLGGPYTGQVKAVLYQTAPGVPVIDLFADAPAGLPKPAAYLLAAHGVWFAPGTVLLAVVDPGVGSARAPVIVEGEGRWYVGPDNGLFEIVARRAATVRTWEIQWRPAALSASFHGRDLFAPIAAQIARGERPSHPPRAAGIGRHAGWPDDLPEVVYIDRYGNAMTGLRAAMLPAGARLAVSGRSLARARTFSDVPPGEAFWYENSNGLAEIAVNVGRAEDELRLAIGSAIEIIR